MTLIDMMKEFKGKSLVLKVHNADRETNHESQYSFVALDDLDVMDGLVWVDNFGDIGEKFSICLVADKDVTFVAPDKFKLSGSIEFTDTATELLIEVFSLTSFLVSS